MLRDLYYRVLYVFQGQKLIFQRGAAAAPVQIGTQDRGGSRSVARPEDDRVRLPSRPTGPVKRRRLCCN